LERLCFSNRLRALFFKKHFQRLYGLAEVGFSLAIGWTSIVKVQSTPNNTDAVAWTVVIAVAYLAVRGLTNYDEAKKRASGRIF